MVARALDPLCLLVIYVITLAILELSTLRVQ